MSSRQHESSIGDHRPELGKTPDSRRFRASRHVGLDEDVEEVEAELPRTSNSSGEAHGGDATWRPVS